MVGREREQHELLAAYGENEAQLVAVYGRRRVGKTYLIRETFHDRFYFQHTGLAKGSLTEQLSAFRDSLIHAGAAEVPELHNWREAFNALRAFIEAGNKLAIGDAR